MANAAFNAWVGRFLQAVLVYNREVIKWNGWLAGKGDRDAKPIIAYNKILTLRAELVVILNSSTIGTEAISGLDKIIRSVGTPTKSRGYLNLNLKNIQDWVKKYSVLLG
jgi:hypothetical protein